MFYIPFINVLVTYYQNTSEHLLVGSILEGLGRQAVHIMKNNHDNDSTNRDIFVLNVKMYMSVDDRTNR